jgi:hypothetical protein
MMNFKHVFDNGNVLTRELADPIYSTYEQQRMHLLTMAEPDNTYLSEEQIREGVQGYMVTGTLHWKEDQGDLVEEAWLFAKTHGRLPSGAGEPLDAICKPALRICDRYAQVKLDHFLHHRGVVVDGGYGCVARVQHLSRTPEGILASLDFEFADSENAFAVVRLPSIWENLYGMDPAANYGLFQFADRKTVVPVTEEQFLALLKGAE